MEVMRDFKRIAKRSWGPGEIRAALKLPHPHTPALPIAPREISRINFASPPKILPRTLGANNVLPIRLDGL